MSKLSQKITTSVPVSLLETRKISVEKAQCVRVKQICMLTPWVLKARNGEGISLAIVVYS